MFILFLFILTNTSAYVCISNKKERELSYTIGNMLTLCYVSPKGK